jgi:hypothetical protein
MMQEREVVISEIIEHGGGYIILEISSGYAGIFLKILPSEKNMKPISISLYMNERLVEHLSLWKTTEITLKDHPPGVYHLSLAGVESQFFRFQIIK